MRRLVWFDNNPQSSAGKVNVSAKVRRLTAFFLVIEIASTVVQLALFWTEAVLLFPRFRGQLQQYMIELMLGGNFTIFTARVPGTLAFIADSVEGQITVTTLFAGHLLTVALFLVLERRNDNVRGCTRSAWVLCVSQLLDLLVDVISMMNLGALAVNRSWWFYPTFLLTVLSLHSSLYLLKTSPYIKVNCHYCYCCCKELCTSVLLRVSGVFTVAGLVHLSTIAINDRETSSIAAWSFWGFSRGDMILYCSLTTALLVSSLLAWLGLSYCQHRCIFRLVASRRCLTLGILCGNFYILQLAGLSQAYSFMNQSDDPLTIRSSYGLAATVNVLFVVLLPWNETEQEADLNGREGTSKSSAAGSIDELEGEELTETSVSKELQRV